MRSRILAGHSFFMSVLLCLACAPEITGPLPAELDELCGETEPFQLLAFDPDRPIHEIQGKVYTDRYVFHMGFDDGSHEVWSTEACGEDPIDLTAGLDILEGGNNFGQWLSAPTVCEAETHDILVLDPLGVVAPYPLFETTDCGGDRNPHGLITTPETNLLVLQPWPSDPSSTARAEQIVLIDDLRAPLESFQGHPSTTDTEVFGVTADNELVVVGLDDLAVNVLATDVFDFRNGERWVLWQGLEITNDNPEFPTGPVFVLDRETGKSTLVTETALRYGSSTMLESHGWLSYVDVVDGKPVDRHVHVPDPAAFELPALEPVIVIDDTHALLGSWPEIFVVVDTTTGESSELPGDFRASSFGANADGISLTKANNEDWRVDYSGTWQLLSEHATGHGYMTTDGRIVVPWYVNTAGIGSLIVEEPGTFEETTVDTQVLQNSVNSLSDDGLIVGYGVGEPDRHGIWLARLAE